MTISILKSTLLGAALAVASAASVQAATVIDFDGVSSGSTANSAAPAGFGFAEAEYVTATDEFGDEIPGSEHWQAVAGASDVLVNNPIGFGFPAAPSAPNALDAVSAPVLLQVSGGIDLGGFSLTATTFDGATFGGAPSASILFLDAAGLALGQLDSQNIPGFFPSLGSPINGVSSILLPSGAFYDNIHVAAVPLPAAVWLFGGALAGLLGFRRRSNSN